MSAIHATYVRPIPDGRVTAPIGRGITAIDRGHPMVVTNRDRSRSPYRPGQGNRFSGRQDRRINPNIRNKRVCWGCGSTEHILSDRKCTPKLETIKTNITDHVTNDSSAMDDLVDQFLTLHARATQDTPSCNETLQRPDHDSPHVHFDESVFKIDEVNALESRVAAQFDNEPYDTLFLESNTAPAIYDCSHINPTQAQHDAKPLVSVSTSVPLGQLSVSPS